MPNGAFWDAVGGVLNPQERASMEALVRDPDVMAEVRRDLDQPKAVGVRGTPMVFVHVDHKSIPFMGTPEIDMFRRYLDGITAS